jgi:hypothetical protein
MKQKYSNIKKNMHLLLSFLSLLLHIISLRHVEALPILASNSAGGRAITGESKKARSNLSAYRFLCSQLSFVRSPD